MWTHWKAEKKKIWNTYAKTTCQRNSLQLIRFHLNSVFCLFISVFMLSLRWACLMFTILSRIHGELVFSQSVIILITAATTKTKCGINNETLGAVLSAVFFLLCYYSNARACVCERKEKWHIAKENLFFDQRKNKRNYWTIGCQWEYWCSSLPTSTQHFFVCVSNMNTASALWFVCSQCIVGVLQFSMECRFQIWQLLFRFRSKLDSLHLMMEFRHKIKYKLYLNESWNMIHTEIDERRIMWMCNMRRRSYCVWNNIL